MPCRTVDFPDGGMAIICSREKQKFCAYCGGKGTQLCDYPLDNGKTCDVPMCWRHTWSPEKEKDYCRVHRRKIEEPAREAELDEAKAVKKRSTLILIAQSKYAGFCRDRDCGQRWEQGEPMYWDKQTREVFCTECGEMMMRGGN